jgi:predicted transposase YbfD/YdcC
MKYNTLNLPYKLPEVPCLLDLEALYTDLATLSDGRKARGLRYPLPLLLLLVLLTKFAGWDEFEEIAHWAKAHQAPLKALLNLKRPPTPHPVTFSRVLGAKIEVAQLEELLAKHFKQRLGATVPARAALVVSIDGKTLRGTIPGGHKQGVHLMVAYLPRQGVVLFQVEVGPKTNEIIAAPKLVRSLDLRGVVVTGDAMQAQRELSVQIVGAGGDYLWLVKANQKGLLGEITQLFEEPPALGRGFSAEPADFKQVCQVEKGHGRLEQRTITVSSLLKGYSYWPELEQVFKLEREWTNLQTGETHHQTRYGVTSIPREAASPGRLMAIARGEWGIENSLHWVRDEDFGEDRA